MNSALHFHHIYRLDFHLMKKILPQTLRRFYGITSSSRYPLVEIIFTLKIKMAFASYETLGFES
jgi:hypothetical protein